ncbi:helix-turn-helix domain-containing protein [Candidatus Woesebacteria bacterium]|nr:helix-turn-helix domain-containing protein [Candidatus Woesebacteria bacterium]
MKTIGEFIRGERLKKRWPQSRLEEETKIKRGFIDAIERQRWELLPDFAVVTGFVRSIAKALEMDEDKTVALLRRDYSPKIQSINPKPDISTKFYWSPHLTFLIGIASLSILVLGYLTFQYKKFLSPPTLDIYEPKENQIVNNHILKVLGKTDSDATISVNNQEAIVDQDGKFETDLEVIEKTSQVEVVAKSRAGKTTAQVRKIRVEL